MPVGFGPLPITKLPKLSGPERAAVKAIHQSYNGNYQDPGRKANQLIFNPTPKMQIHINNMVGGKLAHHMAQQYAQSAPSWTAPVTKALKAGDRQYQREMANPVKRAKILRQQALNAQPMTEGLSVLPGLDNPVTRWTSRLATGAAHAATGLGPGLVDVTKHGLEGLVNVGVGGLRAAGVVHPGGLQGGAADIQHIHGFKSQEPYFTALGKAQLQSFKDSFTTKQFWDDPFQFLSNATIVLSGVAGGAARAAEIADVSRALRAGEITKAEAFSQARRAAFRPQPVERSIQIGPSDKHFNKAGIDVMGHHKTDYHLPSPEAIKQSPYLGRIPIFFRSDAPEKAIIGPVGEGHADLISGGHGHYRTHSQASAIIDPETGQVAQINLHDKMGGMSDEAQKALKEKLMDVVNEKVHEAHHEPYRITPPAVKGALGGRIQKHILDPLTEKAVQGKLHGVQPAVRAIGREIRLPNQLTGLLPEGKAGKLARREFELASQARRGVEEVKIARQFGLKGPYDKPGKLEHVPLYNGAPVGHHIEHWDLGKSQWVEQHLGQGNYLTDNPKIAEYFAGGSAARGAEGGRLPADWEKYGEEYNKMLGTGSIQRLNIPKDIVDKTLSFDQKATPELKQAIVEAARATKARMKREGTWDPKDAPGDGEEYFQPYLDHLEEVAKGKKGFKTVGDILHQGTSHTASFLLPEGWMYREFQEELRKRLQGMGYTGYKRKMLIAPDTLETKLGSAKQPGGHEYNIFSNEALNAQMKHPEGRIPRDAYLTPDERQAIYNAIEKHGHKHTDPYMVEEHLRHVHDEDSGHMVQIMGNEEPLNYGVNHVEHIPDIAALIKKHGGDASHYSFGPEVQDILQEAAGLPDELRPTVSTKTSEVHFPDYASAKNFENEFAKQIEGKYDIGAQHHHINLETEGDIPDTMSEWMKIMHPDAPIQARSQEFAKAVSKELEALAEPKPHVPTLPERTAAMSPEVRKKFAAEAQKRAFAQGIAKQHVDEWHKMWHGVLTHDEVLRGTRTNADVLKRMEDYVGIKKPPEKITKWKQYAGDQAIARQIQGMVETDPKKLAAEPGDYRYVPRGFWQRYKFTGPDVGHAASFINGMDAITQAVRAGRFMTPAYFAWAIQNGILHLSQAGVFGIRNALRLKNEFGKMTPEQKAFFDNSVGAGHYGGGIARATQGSPESFRAVWTQKMAHFWHGVDDRPFRRMSLIHELAHAGYHNAADWGRLMREDPKKFLTIARRAQQEAIDYSEMGPAEKATLQKLFTAWGWTRGASTYTMRFPFQHPAQFAAAVPIARKGEEDVNKYYDTQGGLPPEWLAGYLPLGGGKLLDTGLINPGETLGAFAQTIPGLTKGQTESLASEEAPGPTALMEAITGQGRYGQQYRGNERISGPLSELGRRFKPLGVLETMANAKKGGGTTKQGFLPGLQMALGSPLEELTNPKETAALGMKDYEQALSRPDEIKFRHDWAIQHIPQQLSFLRQHGTHLTPGQIAKWKGDIDAVEQRDLWQVKYAGEHGARSFKSLPAINRLEAGVQFNLQHGYITPQSAKQKLAEASRINDDSILNTLATAEWENHAIGVVANAYSSVIKALQPPSRLPARG